MIHSDYHKLVLIGYKYRISIIITRRTATYQLRQSKLHKLNNNLVITEITDTNSQI